MTHPEYKPTTRSEHGLDYSSLGAQQTYTSQYVGTQAQVPAGLPRSTALSMVPPAQQYSGPHDPVYNQHPDQQYAPQPAYLDTSPRQAPEIISFAPPAGYQGSRVTVYFRSIYDFESPPIQTFLMFGTHRCQSTLMKTAQQNDMYQYELTADAPPFSVTSSPSPTPLRLLFDESLIQWSSPTLDVGSFTYLNTSLYNYLAASPETAEGATRKRKLSPQASPRRSPTKKASFPQLPRPSRISAQPYANTLPANTQIPQFRRPSLPEAYLQQRRVSSEYHPTYSTPAYSAPLPTPQQYYGGQLVGQTTPGLQPPPSPSWAYQHSGVPISRSPSTAAISVGERNPHLRPSPVGGSNPPLVRTSTLQQSPTTPASTIPTFNPYAIYPSNAKANLAIEGELASMADSWSTAEWEARRRLVQFSRSQTGSVISAKFEAVTPEARAPNSICVSCIWWTEKNECYVTSVDTIQLLEALVAVRFTVEEKNRIRRNLEGFRPATVSKAKADSEEFFKLIMGFPNPKPRNIEKDVKVFPWRILATALKKIIGKYASHSRSLRACIMHHAPMRIMHPALSHYWLLLTTHILFVTVRKLLLHSRRLARPRRGSQLHCHQKLRCWPGLRHRASAAISARHHRRLAALDLQLGNIPRVRSRAHPRDDQRLLAPRYGLHRVIISGSRAAAAPSGSAPGRPGGRGGCGWSSNDFLAPTFGSLCGYGRVDAAAQSRCVGVQLIHKPLPRDGIARVGAFVWVPAAAHAPSVIFCSACHVERGALRALARLRGSGSADHGGLTEDCTNSRCGETV